MKANSESIRNITRNSEIQQNNMSNPFIIYSYSYLISQVC